MIYDGNGNHIDGQHDGIKVKPVAIEPESIAETTRLRFLNKPGSALESLIPEWVVQFKDRCGCKDYSKKMDKWGTEGCEARRDEIIEHLMQQSDKLIPIFRGLPDSFRKASAKKLLAKAIAMSQK